MIRKTKCAVSDNDVRLGVISSRLNTAAGSILIAAIYNG
jgi:hypothetical protein